MQMLDDAADEQKPYRVGNIRDPDERLVPEILLVKLGAQQLAVTTGQLRIGGDHLDRWGVTVGKGGV